MEGQNQMIKAIFFDLDGTLISHARHDMPASALEALHALRARGILLFLATGRHIAELPALPLHGFRFDGYVTVTGQLCYDADFRPIHRHPFPDADARALAAVFEAKQAPILIKTETDCYVNYVDDDVRRVLADVSSPVPKVAPYRGEPIYLAATFGEPGRFDALLRKLPGCRQTMWHPNGTDIVSLDGGKVKGIAAVQAHFGLRQDEIMAFGDSDNDADMLEYARIGVAMGNATAAIQAAADYVTAGVDDDGILSAVRHFGLID